MIEVELAFTARCDVRFDRTVEDCTPVASLRFGGAGSAALLAPATIRDRPTLSDLDADEVAVVYLDISDGSLLNDDRPGFQLAVFC